VFGCPYLIYVLGVFIIRRLQDDMQFSAAGEAFKREYVWKSLMDRKTWIASMIVHSLRTLVKLNILLICKWEYTWVCTCSSYTASFHGPQLLVDHFVLLSDGPLYAFSLFTPSIINQASVNAIWAR
jgi:hypothetical protein